MAKRLWKKEQELVANYEARNESREETLLAATMNFVGYFMGLGDDQITAETKVTQMSTEVAAFLYVYTLGNTQPLIDAINNIDEGTYPFMDSASKAYIINELTIA